MKTIKTVMLLLMAIACVSYSFAYDHIIFRNGQESDVKLYQITDEKIVFGLIGDRTGVQKEVASKDVYMVYVENQGNIYLTVDGKRFTGEPQRVNPKKNDVIYLIRGAEIGAENVRITENAIRYSVRAKRGGFAGKIADAIGKGEISESVLDKSEVFMIRYRSGMVDIINPIEVVKDVADTIVSKEQEPQFVVMFHEVRKGDTLEKLAATYRVSVEQLREWNDIPQKTKSTSSLTIGMQLMIYQPKK